MADGQRRLKSNQCVSMAFRGLSRPVAMAVFYPAHPVGEFLALSHRGDRGNVGTDRTVHRYCWRRFDSIAPAVPKPNLDVLCDLAGRVCHFFLDVGTPNGMLPHDRYDT